jgi:predicted metal-dependent phosphoesterase TrpH
MGLADLHMHTIYSYDGTASVPAVLARARQVGLDVIAITDHDEIRGTLQAFELAPEFGIEVIPGIEITTAEGDLLALFVTEKIEPGRPLIETVIKVGEAGGICIVPHPTARGMGMKSLSIPTVLQALQYPDARRILLGIETYNATALDRESNQHAQTIVAEYPGIAQIGDSDAHIVQAIGLGATEFPGCTAADLLEALWIGATDIRRGVEPNSARMLGAWALNYIISAPARVAVAYPQMI